MAMLACSRAVVATTDADTELGRAMAQEANCNLVVPPENPQVMAKALQCLAFDATLRTRLC